MLSGADSRILFALAVAHVMKGNASDAVDIATRCLKIEPDRAEIYLIRGNAFALLLQWQHAISDYSQVRNSLLILFYQSLCVIIVPFA